ncbi:MAG: hypothetical protein KTR16_14185 [Acidiferrobacterales bacterium]|nr:hypothetical protein [Acidiferrobacterales bacterium]
MQTNKVDNSKFRAVLAEMIFKGTLKSLVALVEDAQACPEWAAFVKNLESRREPLRLRVMSITISLSQSVTEMFMHMWCRH